MSQPYLGQIESFPYGFAPKNWLPCNGQTLGINQYQALFALLGTTFGGNGVQTFQLPNMQGNVAIGQGAGAGLSPYVMGEQSGEPNHTLLATETPAHSHGLVAASVTATSDTPAANMALANSNGLNNGSPAAYSLYAPAAGNPPATMSGTALSMSGGQPHNNMMPYLALNFCISMSGIFPSRG